MQVHDFTLLLGSQDPQRLATFYGGVLGLEQLPSKNHLVFRLPGARLRIIDHSEVAPSSAEPQRLILNLFVDDARAELARLEPHGVTVVRPPAVMGWGGYVVTIADPDGNYLQLIEGS